MQVQEPFLFSRSCWKSLPGKTCCTNKIIRLLWNGSGWGEFPSRFWPSGRVFLNIVARRIEAKKSGDKKRQFKKQVNKPENKQANASTETNETKNEETPQSTETETKTENQ